MQVVLSLSLWVAAGVASQVTAVAPGQTAAPPETYSSQATCTLEGKTVNSLTGEPVKWAKLRLAGGVVAGRVGTGAQYTTTSNGMGEFALDNLPPGRYRLITERSGFGGTLGAMLMLAPGQRMTGLELKLRPLAVIAGRVLDEHEEPLAFASVMAMKYTYAEDGKRLLPLRSVTTNDLGEYRVFGLEAGRYYIAATCPSGPSCVEARSTEPQPEEAYATTYYPGTAEIRSATQVEVAAGAVVQNINLQLAKSPIVLVRGSVANLPGTTSSTVMVDMARTDDLASSKAIRGTAANQGRFEFRGVSAGRYTLTATAYDGQKKLQGRQIVDVGTANVENVTIAVGTAFDQPGKVRVDGQAQLPAQRLSVFLRPADSGEGLSGQQATADAEGNFVFVGIWPGSYLLTVSARQSFYAKSMRLGVEDVLETPLGLTGVAGGALSIVLGISAGEVSGVVSSEDGTPAVSATVVLIPESAKRRELLQFYRTATTDLSGMYKLPGVAPGKYKLFAWEGSPGSAWMDPDVLKPVESMGKSIDIQETSKDTVDLRALPAIE